MFANQLNKVAESIYRRYPRASADDIAKFAFTSAILQDSRGYTNVLCSYEDGKLMVYHGTSCTDRMCFIDDVAVEELSSEKHHWAHLAMKGAIGAAKSSINSNGPKKYKKLLKSSQKYPPHRKRYDGILHVRMGDDAITDGDRSATLQRFARNLLRKVNGRFLKKEKLAENKLLSRFSIQRHERELHVVSRKPNFFRKEAKSDSDSSVDGSDVESLVSVCSICNPE